MRARGKIKSYVQNCKFDVFSNVPDSRLWMPYMHICIFFSQIKKYVFYLQATLPTKLPVSPASSISSNSPRHIPSRIPQPESSSPRKSRIPSAPKYHTPNRTFIKPSPAKSSSTTVPNASSRRSVTPSSSSQKYAKDNHSQVLLTTYMYIVGNDFLPREINGFF